MRSTSPPNPEFVATAIALPDYSHSQEEVIGYLRAWLAEEPEKAAKAAAILGNAEVARQIAAGLIDTLNRIIPRSVVRGLQLALGLKLLAGGFTMIAKTGVWIGYDSIATGVACAIVVLLLYQSKRVPAALAVFAIGVVVLLAADPTLLSNTRFGFAWRWPDLGNSQDWLHGIRRAALPQLPLTTLNSVIAVCALSSDLFPKRSAAPRRVAISVGLMNILACPFGAMPMCHGAGGLAAQYRFGARTGGSVVILGTVKIVLALALGSSLLVWLDAYPESVLGVLLLFSGLELTLVCRDQRRRRDFLIMLMTAGACIAQNMAVGFVIGALLAAAVAIGVFRIGSENKVDDQ